MYKIAVVDDEIEIVELLKIYLERNNYEAICFFDSIEAESYLLENEVNALLLDIMMPNLDGLKLLNKIKNIYAYPVLLITAKTDQASVLSGLYSGAVDYIKKPFDALEVIARLDVHLKRESNINTDIITYRNIILDKSKHEFYIGNNLIELTPIEFEIITVLMKNINNVISSDKIFEEVWKEKYYERDSNTVSVHIRNIRYKIYRIDEKQNFIKTVWGVGYKIE